MNRATANDDNHSSDQAGFAAALFDPALTPSSLKTWNGSDPAQRFGVYRNNVIVSLVDALADTFPSTQAVVGERFFRAMARASLAQNLPDTPVLADFGKHFPDFVAAFAPAASLPYLADLARLEFARVEAFHAADAATLGVEDLAPLLADPQRLPRLRLDLHPSLRLLSSVHPIVDLWAANAADRDFHLIDWACAQTALVLRNDLEVEVFSLSEDDATFIAALLAGRPLGEAAAQVSRENFDFSPALGLLLRAKALCGIDFETQEAE